MTDSIKASARPTKQFFVEMLTRDIELEDAILDLLDNCLDGALRVRRSEIPEAEKYHGFWARIELSGDSFLLTDNCGGIPLEIAKNYAFRMGRGSKETDARDIELETVGMYGIGMKRAIFKMGKSAYVTSQTPDDSFQVLVKEGWIDEDDEWAFPIELEERKENTQNGTEVLIQPLHSVVAQTFSDANFLVGLRNRIADHYSMIIAKGFKVFVGSSDEPVRPHAMRLLFDETGIRPYLFSNDFDGVSVFLAVGLNAPAATDADSAEETRRGYDDGGWTIYCNDRAVLVRDKTRVTGWGEGVPSYHWQFSVISGVVEFRAKDARKLPVGTTKRYMDLNNETFLKVRHVMIQALKVFTNYTNWWRHEKRSEQTPHLKAAKPMGLEELKEVAPAHATQTRRKGDVAGAKYFDPADELSKRRPQTQTRTTRRIVFTREASDIDKVSRYLLDDEVHPPAAVGERCFDNALEEAEKTQ